MSVPADPAVAERVARLEEIAGRDVGRGIAPLAAAARGELLAAARSLAGHADPHVAILTGFFVPAAEPPAAETDGPVGAAHLAAALDRAGVPVRLATDEPCATALQAAARAAGAGSCQCDVIGSANDIGDVLDAWSSADPPVSHVIAIERLGPSRDGTYRNMRGDDISPWTAPLDRLFREKEGRVRIGIGDGGNELGMGRLPRDLVAASVPEGELIHCVVGCEHLLVCGVSNWGALALQAALALLRPDWRAALTAGFTAEQDRRILAAAVEEGGTVDGTLRRPALSVDGLPWEEHAEVLRRLVEVLAS